MNNHGEAALFLVSTIYTSIRNNDGCHRTERPKELLEANAPSLPRGSLMEPIFNSAKPFLFSLTLSPSLTLRIRPSASSVISGVSFPILICHSIPVRPCVRLRVSVLHANSA